MVKYTIGFLYSGKGLGKEEKMFLKSAKEKNVELIMFNIFDEIDEDKFEEDIKKCDVVFNSTAEDFAVEIIKSIEELDKKVIDNSKTYYYPEDKWVLYLKCKENKIPTPDTILLSENLDVAKKELESFGKWPVIIKRVYGTMGEFVDKADDLKDAMKVVKRFWKKGSERLPIIAQELISSPSYRVTVIDKKIVQTALKKNNSWKATGNYADSFGKFDVDKKLKKIVKKVINLTKINICGIDFLKRKNDWYVLEVNAEPDFSFFEEDQKRMVELTLNYLKREARKVKNQDS